MLMSYALVCMLNHLELPAQTIFGWEAHYITNCILLTFLPILCFVTFRPLVFEHSLANHVCQDATSWLAPCQSTCVQQFCCNGDIEIAESLQHFWMTKLLSPQITCMRSWSLPEPGHAEKRTWSKHTRRKINVGTTKYMHTKQTREVWPSCGQQPRAKTYEEERLFTAFSVTPRTEYGSAAALSKSWDWDDESVLVIVFYYLNQTIDTEERGLAGGFKSKETWLSAVSCHPRLISLILGWIIYWDRRTRSLATQIQTFLV